MIKDLIRYRIKLLNDRLTYEYSGENVVVKWLAIETPCKDTVRQLNVMSPKMVRLEHSEYLIAQLA